MKKVLLLCAIAGGFPMMTLANDNVELQKEFNGLDIETQVLGSEATGPGPGLSTGTMALQVTNNSRQKVSCQLMPGVSETQLDVSPITTIEPGQAATMRLGGQYADQTTQAKLKCEPAQ